METSSIGLATYRCDAIPFAAAIFTIEYVLRIWSAPDHTPFGEMSESAARWAYARTPLAIIDLICILPVYLALILPAVVVSALRRSYERVERQTRLQSWQLQQLVRKDSG